MGSEALHHGHWHPSQDAREQTNLGRLMARTGFDFAALHAWSVDEPQAYWAELLAALKIHFDSPPQDILTDGPTWLSGASLNIAASCFEGREGDDTVLVRNRADGGLASWSRDELKRRSARVAQGLLAQGVREGDAVAIDMPMTADSVAIYLGIVWMGGVVVSIADSFAVEEIRTRLTISQARWVFTQDQILRGDKVLPLYSRVCAASQIPCVVVPAANELAIPLRQGDIGFASFLAAGEAGLPAYSIGSAQRASNLLFSSGTTGSPKAIPWTQLTPIKAAADGWAHHDIQAGEVIVWPTNLGWMMGPWLIYATLLNGATIGLFEGSPLGEPFARFVEEAKVSMLGLVPSLVRAWRANGALEGCDWSSIRRFSSTGEASNPSDMAWLMAQAGGVPVIEYCGGTEIGGGYLCGSMVQSQRAGQFSCAAMGCRFYLLDEDGTPGNMGEVALVSPLFGASQSLLNRQHDEVYFAGMPQGPHGERLRRHGDFLERLEGGFYRAHGRVDDTMNLGGIKVSSAEIERVVNRLDGVRESAAVAVTPKGGGPSELVLVIVPDGTETDQLSAAAQGAIRGDLNPLFKVARSVFRSTLPRTASNKVMRRVLRAELEA